MAGGSSFAVSRSGSQHVSHRWLRHALLWIALHVAISAAAAIGI